MVKGFSLIELMIVVVIVGIVSAVAVPAYQAYVDNARRSEGTAFALDVASRQESFFTANGAYLATADLGPGAGNLNIADSDAVTAGIQSQNGYYTITSAINAAATTYTLTLATNSWTDSECGDLTLTNTGIRGSERGNAAECWR